MAGACCTEVTAAGRLAPILPAVVLILGSGVWIVAAGEPAPAPPPAGAGREAGNSAADTAAPAPGGAGNSAEAARLQAIRDQIEALRRRLGDSEAQAGNLLDALDEIDLKVAVLGREAVLLEADIAATRRTETAARAEVDRARSRTADAEDALRSWLVEISRTGTAADLRLFMSASTPADLAGAARTAETLALADARRIDDFRAERARLETALHSLEESRERLVALQGELHSRQEDLAQARASKGALLDGIRAREDVEQKALGSLVQVERDLQAMLGSLPGGAVPSYGLPRFHGLLNWPVTGPVAIPFGNVRHPKFSTQVPHPGVEIACPEGETVRAVYDGRVVFSSWFRGFGQMIVIDHGDEYLSIYGQLGERLAEAGQEVRRDEPIARSGGEGTFGVTGLYLEIRHRGRPEDPLPWLRKIAGRPASRTEKKR
jgi:septal ring factor EnvC (AmiA/AmiB activator)